MSRIHSCYELLITVVSFICIRHFSRENILRKGKLYLFSADSNNSQSKYNVAHPETGKDGYYCRQ